jgi:hypothetical protein
MLACSRYRFKCCGRTANPYISLRNPPKTQTLAAQKQERKQTAAATTTTTTTQKPKKNKTKIYKRKLQKNLPKFETSHRLSCELLPATCRAPR